MKTSQTLINEIRDRLVQALHPERIYIFGSQAWGQPTEDSDLDILIVVPDLPEHDRDLADTARQCLKELRVPVDIIVIPAKRFERRRGVYASLEARVADEGKMIHIAGTDSRVGSCV